jgi:hypothetical protein
MSVSSVEEGAEGEREQEGAARGSVRGPMPARAPSPARAWGPPSPRNMNSETKFIQKTNGTGTKAAGAMSGRGCTVSHAVRFS